MKIEEQVLSREQMAHLEEMGIDTSDASMAWVSNSDNPKDDDWTIEIPNEHLERYNQVPTYTIGDLIEKLPEEIKYRGFMIIKRPKFTIWDICALKSDFDVEYFGGSTLKDALYDLLCWTIKNHKELIK